MKPWKSPGPYGFPAGFFQENKHQVRNSMICYIQRLWAQPQLIQQVNGTDICLIPKVDRPEFISQFCPTSLCNVDYKVLTKIVVQRLKPLMPEIISPYQTGFVPTRSIHENIVITQEMVHSMRNKGGVTGFLQLKLILLRPMTDYVGPLFEMCFKKYGSLGN